MKRGESSSEPASSLPYFLYGTKSMQFEFFSDLADRDEAAKAHSALCDEPVLVGTIAIYGPQESLAQNFGYPLYAPHPVQPLLWVNSRAEFKPNAIVRHLLDNGPFDMNKLACMNFTDEDREQFAQLIGYSANWFAELSYVSDETYSRALAGRELR